MYKTIIKKRLVVPQTYGRTINKNISRTIATQLDSALLSIGFYLSKDLITYISSLNHAAAEDVSKNILNSVKELVGDNVKYNVYFKNFPNGVPDTLEFWFEQIIKYIFTGTCEYGRYQHTYEEMLASREQFLESSTRKLRQIQLGDSLESETSNLYKDLAQSSVPLNPEDRTLLGKLVNKGIHVDVIVPIRENKAILNTFLAEQNLPLTSVDTLTDILRVAAGLSGGDITLVEKTKFKSFSRPVRRNLLKTINDIVDKNESKIDDLFQYREQWKRLGERLHVNEFTYDHAKRVFKIARGQEEYTTWNGKLQKHLLGEEYESAVKMLVQKPGYFVRQLDQIIRNTGAFTFKKVLAELNKVLDKVSIRVLLSLREFLINRNKTEKRIFVNKKGKAWVKDNSLNTVSEKWLAQLYELIDSNIISRLPKAELLLDSRLRDMLDVALPISEKNKSEGFDTLPRGSILSLKSEFDIVRLFAYWKEKSQRTDYDLSCVFFDENFNFAGQVSWTSLSAGGYATHSGDITHSERGASEFLDINTKKLPKGGKYFIPTLNVFSGEAFDEVEECFFGFMERALSEKGKPFEAKSVTTKFDLRDKGKVCLPLAFYKDGDSFKVKWLDLYMKGVSWGNMVEQNKLSSSLLAKTIINREYLTVGWLLSLYEHAGAKVKYSDEVTTNVISLSRLSKLIP